MLPKTMTSTTETTSRRMLAQHSSIRETIWMARDKDFCAALTEAFAVLGSSAMRPYTCFFNFVCPGCFGSFRVMIKSKSSSISTSGCTEGARPSEEEHVACVLITARCQHSGGRRACVRCGEGREVQCCCTACAVRTYMSRTCTVHVLGRLYHSSTVRVGIHSYSVQYDQ